MAVYVKRPEMQALCRAARKSGDVITPEAVRSVLPDASDVACRNIIDWCHQIGLCDDHGRLSEAGEQTASEEGEAPLLEQGVYAMWGVKHPVLGGRILHWERIRIDRNDEGIPAPLPLKIDLNQVWRSVISGKRFAVRGLPSGNLEPLGYTDSNHQSTCEFRWNIDFRGGISRWVLAGHIAGGRDGDPGPIRFTPTNRPCDLRTLADRWMGGVNPSEGRWNPQHRRLDVAFKDALDETVRQTFQTTVRLAEVEGPDGDVYENVRITEVPVGPATPDDARRWMMWRLRRRLAEPGYRSVDALNADFVSVTEGTPLESMTAAPEPEEILKEARNERPVFWRVAAGLDLTCEPRGMVPKSTKVAISAQSSPASVRLVRNSNLSMQELLSRLLGPIRPRRVLICDRFVRGDGNLACLKLFHDALRQQDANSRLLVLTDRDAEDPTQAARIQKIVGELPVWYEQAFGRIRAEQPHDRFLLVDAGDTRLAWQMSNSPLDARPLPGKTAAPDTPLKWRDLACTPVAPPELYYPYLVKWFDGGKPL
jgi:hypothetical protein